MAGDSLESTAARLRVLADELDGTTGFRPKYVTDELAKIVDELTPESFPSLAGVSVHDAMGEPFYLHHRRSLRSWLLCAWRLHGCRWGPACGVGTPWVNTACVRCGRTMRG